MITLRVKVSLAVVSFLGVLLLLSQRNHLGFEEVSDGGIERVSREARSKSSVNSKGKGADKVSYPGVETVESWTYEEWESLEKWLKNSEEVTEESVFLRDIVSRNPHLILELCEGRSSFSFLGEELASAMWTERASFFFVGDLSQLRTSNRLAWQMLCEGGIIEVSSATEREVEDYCRLFELADRAKGLVGSVDFVERVLTDVENSPYRRDAFSLDLLAKNFNFDSDEIFETSCLLAFVKREPMAVLSEIRKDPFFDELFVSQLSEGIVMIDPEVGLHAIYNSRLSEDVKAEAFRATVRKWINEDSFYASNFLLTSSFNPVFKRMGYEEVKKYLLENGVAEQGEFFSE